MQKVLKRVAIALLALAATVCMVVLAACQPEDDNGEDYATTSFTITVKDENGNTIDGTMFGEKFDSPTAASVEFCVHDQGCWGEMFRIDADGKVTVSVPALKEYASGFNSDEVEVHIRNISAKGYTEDYGVLNVNQIPLNVEITLKKA